MEQTAMTDEIWKDIEGCGGVYMVSNMGRVKNCNRNKLLSGSLDKDGYHIFELCYLGNKKKHKLHRLVASAFLPLCIGKTHVNHKDEDKLKARCIYIKYLNIF